MNRILYIFLLAYSLSGCKDIVDIPDVVNDTPVFTSHVVINGESLILEAGKHDYHNHPKNYLSTDTLTMTSTFKYEGCDQNCPNSLTFSFKADKTWAPNQTFDQLISTGSKPLTWEALRDSQIVRVRRTSEGQADMSYFEYGGKRQSANMNNDPIAITIPKNEIVEICITDHSSTLGTATQCQFFLQKREQPPRVKLKIKDANEVRLIAEPIQPFDLSRAQFSWNTLTTGEEITVTKDRLLANEVCVKVHYPDQRESQSCIEVLNDIKDFDLVSGFEAVLFEEIKPIQPQQFGFVDVSFIDDTGKEFVTSKYRQRPTSFFEVVSVEDFYDEWTELTLKRLTIRFELELFARDGERIEMKSEETTIALLPQE